MQSGARWASLRDRYRPLILEVAARRGDAPAARLGLEDVLRQLDREAQPLPYSERWMLRRFLVNDLEREALGGCDPETRAMLVFALKRLCAP